LWEIFLQGFFLHDGKPLTLAYILGKLKTKHSSDDLRSSDEYSRSTRTDFRPFTIEEQKRILTVGACLTCHDENSKIILNSLDEDFENYLLKISEDCVLPGW